LSHPLLYARILGNRLKVRQFGVLFPIPQLAFAGNCRVKEIKRVRAAGKSTREITIIKIPGVLCLSYGVVSNHVREKIFPHLFPRVFISDLSWIAGWLTSRHIGRGDQDPIDPASAAIVGQ
jgi:hypothetical protein